MNKLNFKALTNKEHGLSTLSIELFIDDKSIDSIFDVGDPYLPYWLFEDDLPYFPPSKKHVEDFSRRIIGACDCGEYGCGNIKIRLLKYWTW